ncbi:PQQ-dependent sugar dehydrogenase [Autumnicola musiva]|uniref:PQQ-dependent sugar dehydrogenase n=1 Tax=Autumnicola musiva TaxID=3075589 RepID=A0ABU3D616_9FLAO|nr:PQQ-dependent sugar dehydrogenase [Zunongwangia sp. F117]MDT0676866.1 PQQ-dependent sugar dehydrogenase [Zunongwangia sp. F117]
MKKLNYCAAFIAALALLFSSCSKDENNLTESDPEKATLSFSTLLNDLVSNKAALKQQIGGIPECSDNNPAYVEIALSQDGAWAVGNDDDPVRVDLNPNPDDSDGDGVENYFTEYSSQLELVPGTYTLEYFTVFDANGNEIWIAPREMGSLDEMVDTALPFDISLGAGVKKYVSVDVMCYDNRMVNEYGYLFFDIIAKEAIEFCIFGNYCDDNGRHYPAHFSVDVWNYSGDIENPMGTPIGSDLMNMVGVNNNGDAYADPLCIVLPDGSGIDEYYIEISLMPSDEYDAEEEIIRSGLISDEDIRALFDGESNNDYFHFMEGDCGNGAADSPALFADVELAIIADNMVSPLGVVAAPDDSERLFVIDQIGKIWVIDESGNKLEEPFLDISGEIVDLRTQYDERGLLGLAFHPDYAVNGLFYVYYTAPPRAGGPETGASWNNTSRISEFSVSPSTPNQADSGSERIVLEVDQPQTNHEGGTIAFGPDGYLYISIGDGGGSNDVAPGHVEDWYEVNAGGNGQDIEANLLGNILRIDVNGRPYSIPADNPFVDGPGLDEIYAYGFRNPYRFSFDMGGMNELYVGDAGQLLWEEVSIVNKGGNYGWNVKEGTHCFNASNNEEVLPNCPEVDIYGNPLIDPVIEMKNYQNPAGGRTSVIVGGYVYRGNDLPEFQGQYIFGSFSNGEDPLSGEIFVALPSGSGLWSFVEIDLAGNPDDIGYYLKGFGQDLEGEIYIAVSEMTGPTGNTGKILKLSN